MNDRNIILCHLESLNYLNYRTNIACFKNLYGIEKESISFSKYYSSATSTIMALTDIAFENQYVNENARAVRWEKPIYTGESFLNKLIREGYTVNTIALTTDLATIGIINEYELLGSDIRLDATDRIDEYHINIQNVINSEKPFLIWLCNFASHVEINRCAIASDNGLERWKRGYEFVDSEIGYLLQLLKKNNCISNTTIVFYGDHGDDFYSHGMHLGLTHAIEPYDQLIHTPFFIYDNRIAHESTTKLVSAEDIGGIVNRLLSSNGKVVGLDDIVNERQYVFSRNMYAGQRVRSRSFGKAYSVCNGTYLLMVSEKGLAMFRVDIDPGCNNNLLLLYKMNNGKLEVDLDEINSYTFHFKSIFDDDAIYEIKELFVEMKEALYKYVFDEYKYGLCSNRIFEMDFDHIACWPSRFYSSSMFDRDNPMFDLCECYFSGKRIVLYGAGKYGKFCYNHVKNICILVGWIDNNVSGDVYDGICICAPSEINHMDFDLIYIAILDETIYHQVFVYLVKQGIDTNKII